MAGAKAHTHWEHKYCQPINDPIINIKHLYLAQLSLPGRQLEHQLRLTMFNHKPTSQWTWRGVAKSRWRYKKLNE